MEPSAKRVRESDSKGIVFQNYVATGDFGRTLDLKALEKHWKEENRHEPGFSFSNKFQGLYIKRTQPDKINAVVFQSGKLICYGAKSDVMARNAVTSMLNALRLIIYPMKSVGAMAAPEPAKIQNIIASFDLGFEIQLEHLALSFKNDVVYEPEIFRPLVFTIKELPQKVVAFISAKGKVILTGAKFEDDLQKAHKILVPKLTKFRRDGPNYRLKSS